MRESELVREFLSQRDALFAFVLALTRRYDHAEEIFQEIGVAIVADGGRGRSPENLPAWLRGVARNKVMEFYRRRARDEAALRRMEQTAAIGDIVQQAFEESLAEAEDANRRVALLRGCLDRLAGKAREAIELRYRDHKSLREIAATMAWGENSVKVALSRARKVLGECVGRQIRSVVGE